MRWFTVQVLAPRPKLLFETGDSVAKWLSEKVELKKLPDKTGPLGGPLMTTALVSWLIGGTT